MPTAHLSRAEFKKVSRAVVDDDTNTQGEKNVRANLDKMCIATHETREKG